MFRSSYTNQIQKNLMSMILQGLLPMWYPTHARDLKQASEQEADAIKGIILASEPVYVEDQEYDLERVIKKILHSFLWKEGGRKTRVFYIVKLTSTSTLHRTF